MNLLDAMKAKLDELFPTIRHSETAMGAYLAIENAVELYERYLLQERINDAADLQATQEGAQT